MTATTSASAPSNNFPPDYVRESGPPDGPVVAMIGEILAGGAAWRAHAKRLSDDWRVLTFSPLLTAYTGVGQIPPEPWSIASEAEAFAAYLDSRNIELVHLAGWSLGGAMAMDFAMAQPDRVESLTLVEPQVWWVMHGLGRLPPDFADIIERYRRYKDGGIDDDLLAEFLRDANTVEPGGDPRQTRGWRLAQTHKDAVAYTWRIIHTEGDLARIARLTMPVLLVRGDTTSMTDKIMGTGLAELIDRSETLVLSGNHSSHITNVDAFMGRFTALLERSDG